MSKFEMKSLNLILRNLIAILNFKNDKHYHYHYNQGKCQYCLKIVKILLKSIL
jgi:hypothetical protein